MSEENGTAVAAPATSMERVPTALWDKLFAEALTKPGVVSEAYTAFHNYSLSNQVWLYMQHQQRGLPVGPCAGYNTWKSRNRWVKEGEKGLAVLAPVKQMQPAAQEDGTTKLVERVVGFRIQKTSFTYCQTKGDSWEDEKAPAIGEIDVKQLVARLGIEIVPFEDVDGNCQGYAKPGKKIAVSPIAEDPAHTFVHEIAHVLLGHCDEESTSDGTETPRSLREVEAEGVAYLIGDLFKVGNPDFSRGYIQSWWQEKGLPEGTSKKVFSAAEKVFRAILGRERSPRALPQAA